MSLALIQSTPEVIGSLTLQQRSALAAWSFNHWSEHVLIFQAIQNQYGINLEQFILDPITNQNPQMLANWLSLHQQLHDDFNSILGYPGNDLQDVDLTNAQQRDVWSFLHWQEHSNAETQLGFST